MANELTNSPLAKTSTFVSRDEATRTPDPYVPNVVRYQLRYIRCRRYHGAAYSPHRFSLFTWASARCCTGSCVKIKKVPKHSRSGTPLFKG